MFLSALLSFLSSNILYFALHLTNTSSFPKPLSPKEEKQCFARMQAGDRAARDKLIEHNLRLVAHIIKKYYAGVDDQEDLISIGAIGLIKAVNTFRPDKGIRFSTYASRCVENEVLMHFRQAKKTVGDVYINDPIDTDREGNALTLIDIVADEENILDDIDLKLRAEQLHKYIEESLSERERKIIILRYGLGSAPPMTQREVAQRLNISRSYVSRIEKKALGILRLRFED